MEKALEDVITQEFEKYIYILKHEIKNPVLAQIQALEYLASLNNMNLRDEQKELLDLTLESCHKQCEILDMLVNTLNYKKRNVYLKKERVNLVSLMVSILTEKRVNFYCSKEYINVCLDREIFEKVLCGLLECVDCRKVENSILNVNLYEIDNGFRIEFCGGGMDCSLFLTLNSLDYQPVGALVNKELRFAMLESLGFVVKEQVLKDKYSLTINYA